MSGLPLVKKAASAPAIILELSAVVSVRALGLMQPYWFKSYIVWTYSLYTSVSKKLTTVVDWPQSSRTPNESPPRLSTLVHPVAFIVEG